MLHKAAERLIYKDKSPPHTGNVWKEDPALRKLQEASLDEGNMFEFYPSVQLLQDHQERSSLQEKGLDYFKVNYFYNFYLRYRRVQTHSSVLFPRNRL